VWRSCGGRSLEVVEVVELILSWESIETVEGWLRSCWSLIIVVGVVLAVIFTVRAIIVVVVLWS